MIWIVISVIIVSGVVLLNLRAKKGLKYSLSQLKGTIKALLKRGYENGILVIESCPSKHFLDFRSTYVLEFRKYIHAPGDYGITLCFTEKTMKWSPEGIQKIQAFCHAQGIDYVTPQRDSETTIDVMTIDFGKNTHTAYRVCKHLLLEIFEFTEEMTFFTLFDNGTENDVLIERKHVEKQNIGLTKTLSTFLTQFLYYFYSEIYISTGSDLSSKGHYQRALAAYTRFIVRYPNATIGYYNRGMVYEKMEHDEHAIEEYTHAIVCDPNSAEAYCRRGLAHARTEHYEQAIEDFTQAITLDPSEEPVYMGRGIAYAKCGQSERAIQDFTQVIMLNPTFAEAHYLRGSVYAELGDNEHAASDFDTFLGLGGATSEHAANVRTFIRTLGYTPTS